MRALIGLLALALIAACVEPPAENVEPKGSDAKGTSADETGTAAPDEASLPSAAPSRPRLWLDVRSVGFYPVNPGFEANRTELVAGGNVTLRFRNDDLNPLGKHDWYLEGAEGAHTKLIAVGEETTLDFVAPAAPGEYKYVCHVDGHEARGMRGSITVAAD